MLINIDQAVSNLKAGNVVVLPTDTVYGLACDYKNNLAVQKIYDLKGRSQNKPLIILISNFEMIEGLIKNYDHKYQILIDKYWPGALTLIFNKSDKISNLVSANTTKIGVRMPANKQILEVIKKFGKPIVATSVNKSGESCLTNILEIQNTFSNINILTCKEEMQNKESTILDISGDKAVLIREGVVSKEDLHAILNEY